jgi:CubicO group peptidase (beta-lactamase class C family)
MRHGIEEERVVSEPIWAADVRDFVRGLLARQEVPGLALAAARAGQEIYAEGFGLREVGGADPITPDTIFGVASVTKGFTALAIMQLAEAGRLAVDDPVTRYLPAYRTPDPAAARATTLHHFLTHTAGLPPLPSRFFALARAAAGDPFAAAKPAWVADHAPLDNADDLLAYIADLDFTPLGPPGAHFSYCNEGFALLGAIVERVSGQRYAAYVQEHILDPLGMTRSTFDGAALASMPDVATLHVARATDGRREVVAAPQRTYVPLWYPAGGLNTTVRDLLRYLEIYRTGGVSVGARLLSAAGIARMTTAHNPGGSPRAAYGYGLGVTHDYHGVTIIQHGGGSKGIAAQVIVAPEAGYTAAAIANLAEQPTDRAALAPLNRLLDLPAAANLAEYGDATYPVEQLRRYVGTYRGGEGQHVVVALDDNGLTLTTPSGQPAARPVGDHGFVLTTPAGEMYTRFLLENGGPAWAVALGSRIVPRVSGETAP